MWLLISLIAPLVWPATCVHTAALHLHHPRSSGVWRQERHGNHGKPSTLNCTWYAVRQRVDHFGTLEALFPQWYCVYDKWWKPALQSGFNASTTSPGPIFFYTGNESPVGEYVNNTGLMWELGERMGALLVFAEHRCEPDSNFFQWMECPRCVSYCTTAQALQDYADIMALLRKRHSQRAPVVVFGGSYGGMLAGWMRMKYPEVIGLSTLLCSTRSWLVDAFRQRSICSKR